ncbi:hypothetical protein [Rhodococcus gannanensis]|uniref:Uncharacterized protein n=1 Tax=Rhodococcus gannanensis TaxID=1960308 RepID=A0ABW4NZ41_9NOCA
MLAVIIVSTWLALSVVAALVFGAMIRLRDRREAGRYDGPDSDPADTESHDHQAFND